MPRLLAFDTATDIAHLGLGDGQRQWVRALPGGAQTSTLLLPALQDLMSDAGLGWRDLDAIACGRGPGAFTGLRTACSIAQGLALGAGLPVLALDTLAAVAQAACPPDPAEPVWTVVDARMGELYAACWRWQGPAHWQAECAPALYTPVDWADAVRHQPGLLAGTGLALPAVQDALAAAGLGTALRQAQAQGHDRAVPDGVALLALAGAALARGQQTDAAGALPLYVRDKVAQTTAERAQARAAAAAG